MKFLTKSLFLIVFFGLNTTGIAYFDQSTKNEPAIMNDIKFEDFKDFTEKWHLVTVRYRTDSNEMRMTYANDIAWKEMQSLKPNYPDGAMFGKVGLITEKDPAFASSEVPSGAKRYQLMVRNKKKYADTKGWGYALFDEKGLLFNEDIKLKTQACAACHAVVPERDFVFSRPMSISFGSESKNVKIFSEPSTGLKFEAKSLNAYPASFVKNVSAQIKTIASLEGEIKKHSFSGTLDEIIPFLIEYSKKEGKTTTLFLDEKNYSLVSPKLDAKKCENSKVPYQIIIIFNGSKVRETVSCH